MPVNPDSVSSRPHFPAADPENALQYPAMNATTMNDSAEQAVRAALARFNAAAKVGDAAALAALLAEDLMYSHSNAKVENKAECIAALVRSRITNPSTMPIA